MATPAPDTPATLSQDAPISQTITYRGPTVLLGAFAHLLRDTGLEFDRPSDDRRVAGAVVEAVLSVSSADPGAGLTVVAMVATAVTKFTTRFGDDSASIRVGVDDSVR